MRPDKGRIRNLLSQYDLGATGKIFVVGYTDSTGGRTHNYKLSRKRAQGVRRAMISAFNLESEKVIAVGKGPENPIAGNNKKEGRAKNRRAEIYISNAVSRQLREKYNHADPSLQEIDGYIENARKLVKQQQIRPALQSLQRARAIGGDQYSDWHAVFGIVGYYAGVPLQKVKTHLLSAVRLDPHNFEARDFIGRIEARERVDRGEVTAAMGRTAADPIAVVSMVQQYEYLNLFGVEPVAHHTLDDRPVDVWEGHDRQQKPVVYYFDHSQIYTWVFFGTDNPAKAAVSNAVARTAAPVHPASAATLAKPVQAAGDATPAESRSPVNAQVPRQIWESDLFQ